jgi:hypothetical protein
MDSYFTNTKIISFVYHIERSLWTDFWMIITGFIFNFLLFLYTANQDWTNVTKRKFLNIHLIVSVNYYKYIWKEDYINTNYYWSFLLTDIYSVSFIYCSLYLYPHIIDLNRKKISII